MKNSDAQYKRWLLQRRRHEKGFRIETTKTTFYCHKSHRTRHVQVDNWRWKRSQQYMAHQPTKKILRMKTTQGRIHVQTTRDQRSRPIKMVFLDNICIMACQTIMINKDGFSTTYVLWWLSPSCLQKAKWLKIRLSIPVESKIAEKTLEPADEGSQQARTRNKIKTTETKPRHRPEQYQKQDPLATCNK